MSLIERMKATLQIWDDDEPRADWWSYQQDHAEALEQLEAMQAENKLLREELRLWLILVNEGDVPRYTVQPGAALNTVVTSTKRLVGLNKVGGE